MKTHPLIFVLGLLLLRAELVAQAPAAATDDVYVPERAASANPTPTAAVAGPTSTPLQAAAPAPAPVEPAKKTPPTITGKAPAGTTPPLQPRFQQVRDKIDALFRNRGESLPDPDPKKNPFRPAGSGAVAKTPSRGSGVAEKAAPPPSASATDLAILQQAAATLKVAGSITIGGVNHLSINQVPYKEGDVINVRLKGQIAFVRVKNISRYSYTLSLNGAELSVKY
jgi:hypothetical protein